MNSVRSGAVRTVLIGYGVAALTLLLGRTAPAAEPFGLSATTLVIFGVLIQITLIGARWLMRRRMQNEAEVQRLLGVLELVADGTTVLLFAAGTLGGIQNAARGL